MKFSIILFALFSTVFSLKCYFDANYEGDNHVGFETSQVCSAGCEYCVKVNGMDLAKPVSGWGCGCGAAFTMNVLPCTGAGITNLAAYQGSQYCCKGDLCNFIASTSLFPVFLIIGFFAVLMQ